MLQQVITIFILPLRCSGPAAQGSWQSYGWPLNAVYAAHENLESTSSKKSDLRGTGLCHRALAQVSLR